MTKKSKKPLDILKNKEDKLDWHKFNFLENLLVFCVLPEKNVPKESGVHFRITPRSCKDSLCLLFKIDRGKDSLFEDGEIKPDYLALYLKENFWLFTIIEMKGTTEKGSKHGIEQIKALREKLKSEFRDNFPNSLRIKFQAIILSPPNTQTPDKLIAQESKRGFIIRPLQYHHKAELFDYISQELQSSFEKYKHQEIKSADTPLFIETILSKTALPERIADKFSDKNKDKTTSREGIYVNYAIPQCDDYTAFTADGKKLKVAVKETERDIKEKFLAEFQSLGLTNQKHFEIVEIEN